MDYYNDIDPFVCGWLKNLIFCGDIRDGDVDSRSITDVQGSDLANKERVHFFAGIGGWAEALRLAGWPDGKPVWTGSCPCQPFSSAGKQKGFDDERHLWPEFLRLIAECKPPTIFGEQVASKAGRDWLAVVRTDLEALGYAVGAADLCAASVGAPHIRQRLFWVADSNGWGRSERQEPNGESEESRQQASCGYDAGGRCGDGASSGMADTDGGKSGETRTERVQPGGEYRLQHKNSGTSVRLGNAQGNGREQGWTESDRRDAPTADGLVGSCSVHFTPCRDGKARPTIAGVRLLAHGFPNRVGLLRGFGNTIVPQIAAEFIKSYMDVTHGH